MRILPDDFNVNILLQEAVWLLISVLIGRVSVQRLKTDTITVRPIHGNLARCIHCSDGGLYGVRKKIEQLSEQKSKKSIVRQK